jgi:putative SOS response-associated peptidase YedK
VCGRFSITGDLDFYAEYFGVDEVLTDPLAPSWNVAPTDPVYVISERDDSRRLTSMSWGLVPHWATDPRSIHINARSETVGTNASFRDSFAKRRCLIPADGFYEWEPKELGRTPHWVFRADGFPLVFAGIWAARHEQASDEWHRSCAIITASSNGVINQIHDRMPVSLPPETWDLWLDRNMNDSDAALEIIKSGNKDEIMEHVVSSKVNSVKNNGPELRYETQGETLF